MSAGTSPQTEDHVDGFDRHGFAVFRKGYDPEAERCHSCFRKEGNLESNVTRWQKLLEDSDMDQSRQGAKFRQHLQHGVPHHLRGTIWKRLLDVEVLRAESDFNYKAQLVAVREQLVDLGITEYGGYDNVTLLSDLESEMEPQQQHGHIRIECIRQILLDLDRSFPTHKKFLGNSSEAIEGRAALFRILAAYARYNPEVGYCQGMSYVAGMLLMYMNEIDAFWCMVSLFERPKYLKGYFVNHMARIQRHAGVFQKLMKLKFPRLSQHMAHVGVDCLMFIAPWFLVLFSGLPCWESVLVVWDLFLLEGTKGLFQAGLALLSLLHKDLIQAHDLSAVLPMLLHPPREKLHFWKFSCALWQVTLEEWEVHQMEAVVAEEGRTGLRSATKRSRAHTDAQKVQPAKRPRVIEPAPSMLQKFVNIFAPKDQRDQPVQTTPSQTRTTVRQELHCNVLAVQQSESTGSMSVSPCEEASESSVIQDENRTPNGMLLTPVRRSPRLMHKRALRDVNTPTSTRSAKMDYSFSAFKTPTPLRHSQHPMQRRGPSFGSPERELRPLILSGSNTPKRKFSSPKVKTSALYNQIGMLF